MRHWTVIIFFCMFIFTQNVIETSANEPNTCIKENTDWRECVKLGLDLYDTQEYEAAYQKFETAYIAKNRADNNIALMMVCAACQLEERRSRGCEWLQRYIKGPGLRNSSYDQRQAIEALLNNCLVNVKPPSHPLKVGQVAIRVHTSSKHFYDKRINDGPAIPWSNSFPDDGAVESIRPWLDVFDRKQVNEALNYWREKTKPLISNSKYGQYIFFYKEGMVVGIPNSDSAAKLLDNSDIGKKLGSFMTFLHTVYKIQPSEKLFTILATHEMNLYELQSLLLGVGSLRTTVVGFSIRENLTAAAYLKRPYFGTVLHELTHLVIGEDFPGVPYWLEEGLAMLYEQSDNVNGYFRGRPNWRIQDKYPNGYKTLNELLAVTPEIADDNNYYENQECKPILGRLADIRALALYLQNSQILPKVYVALREQTFKKQSPLSTQEMCSILEKISGKQVKDLEKLIHISDKDSAYKCKKSTE